jgi:hypothetical protein
MRNQPRFATAAAIVLALAGIARAADYAGAYRGTSLALDLSADASGGYTGTLRLGQQSMPCRANPDGDHLAGTFDANKTSYRFTATLAGDTLTLLSAGTQYTMTRPATAVAPNPLARGGAPPAATPTDVAELARTATGRTLLLPQPSATTAEAALDGALPRLPVAVGGAITVQDRFADAKQPTRGGASFTATVDGRPVHGVCFCGSSTAGGEDVSVAYCAADAPPAEWAALTAALPHRIALHEYAFPDGTGSIGVPDGWTCPAKSACVSFHVDGPDGQQAIIFTTIDVDGEQSGNAKTDRSNRALWQENEDRMRRMNAAVGIGGGGGAAPPRSAASRGIYICDIDEPVAMLVHIYPLMSERMQATNGGTQRIDRVIATTPATPTLKGGRATLLSMLYSITKGSNVEHFHFEGRLESDPIDANRSMLTISGMQAHVETFDRDLPTMSAILGSLKVDGQQMTTVMGARCAATAAANAHVLEIQNASFQERQRDIFARNQEYHDWQSERFDRIEQGINNQSLASHRASADVTEMVGGYQKVVNARTGEELSVNYYNGPGIVAGLNEQAGNTGEWVAVHRRDEMYPLAR